MKTSFPTIDKNLALNVNDFSIFGNQEDLCRNIFFFLCNSYEKNLFSLTEISVDKVVNFLGLSPSYRTHLNRTLDYPYQSIIDPYFLKKREEGEIVWDSVFEDALYRLNRQTFAFSYGGVLWRGNEKIEAEKQEAYNLITSIEQYRAKTGKTYKKQYCVKLNEHVLNNLGKWFMFLNFDAFKKLKKSRKLYTYLSYLRHIWDGKEIDPSKMKQRETYFDFLCKLTNANCANPKNNMVQINSHLNEIMKCDPDFFRQPPLRVKSSTNDRFGYNFIFDFNPFNFAEDQKQKVIRDKISTHIEYFLVDLFLKKNPSLSIPEIGREEHFEKYKEWLKNPLLDYQEKFNIFCEGQYFVFKKKFHIDHSAFDKYVNDVCNHFSKNEC